MKRRTEVAVPWLGMLAYLGAAGVLAFTDLAFPRWAAAIWLVTGVVWADAWRKMRQARELSSARARAVSSTRLVVYGPGPWPGPPLLSTDCGMLHDLARNGPYELVAGTHVDGRVYRLVVEPGA